MLNTSRFSPNTYYLLLILVMFVGLAGIYSWLLPPFEYADEPRHFAYAQWFAEGKGLPPQGQAAWETPIKQEAGQPPLYHFIASFPMYLLMQVDGDSLTQYPLTFRPNPTYNGSHTRYYADNDDIALHYPSDTTPLQGEWFALYLMRGITIGFGVLLLVATYGLTRQLFSHTPFVAVLVTLCVAMTPQVLYISSTLSNDIPASALATLTLWQLAIIIYDQVNIARATRLGIFMGLAALTKVSTLVLLPAIVLAYLWLWWVYPPQRKATVQGGLFTALLLVMIAGWWFAHAWLRYGTPLGLTAHDYAPWAFTEIYQPAGILTRWQHVFASFWVSIGWGPVQFPPWLYQGLSILVALALVRGAGAIKQARQRTFWQKPSAIMTIVFLLMIAGSFAALEVWMQRVAADFGRLLFPALAPIMILLAWGWQRIGCWLLWSVAGLLTILAFLTPFLILYPTYHPHPLSPAQIEQLPPSLGWQFGEVAELISVTPAQRSAPADTILPIEVCWRIHQATEENYLILVQLVGANEWVAARRTTIPGLGTYPSVTWQAGDVFCDQVEVRLWDNIVQTQLFQVEINLLTVDERHRLSALDAQGNPLTTTFATTVRLVTNHPPPLDFPTSLPPYPIVLLQAEFAPLWSAGHQESLTLYWGVQQPVTQDYQTFVHILDAQTGDLVAQADGAPLQGHYDTSWWEAHEIVADTRTITLPASLPAGTYEIWAGFYDLTTRERLPEAQQVGHVQTSPE